MQTVQDFIKPLSDAELSRRYGRDRSYWCHVRRRAKDLSRPAALAIWRKEKVKLGPIADMDDDDVAVLARLDGGA